VDVARDVSKLVQSNPEVQRQRAITEKGVIDPEEMKQLFMNKVRVHLGGQSL
jgi:hypothetical protein